MFRLIIVDDEDYIRDMFYYFLDWEALGFTIAADFSTVQAALDYIEQHPVDAIVTDIAMPELSGIDFAAKLLENEINIPVIFLTGHCDFSFAKKAVKLGIFAYLVKPITYEELFDTFSRLAVHLAKTKNTFISESTMEKRSSFLSAYLLNNKKECESHLQTASFLTELGLHIDPARAPVFLSLMIPENFENYLEKTWRHSLPQITVAMSNIIYEEDNKVYIIPVRFMADLLILFIIAKEEMPDIQAYVMNKCNQIKKRILTLLKMSVKITPICSYSSFYDIHQNDFIATFKIISGQNAQPIYQSFVEKVRHLIVEHLNTNMTQEDIARQLNMNITSFRKLFKDMAGERFIDFSVHVKLEEAKRMLVETDYKIADIAARIGYKSEDYFYTTFKKNIGMTPAEYRRINTHSRTE